MSRGLGALQRTILGTLDEARQAAPRYPGSGYSQAGLVCSRYGDQTPEAAGWLWVGHSCVLLAPSVYDLRASMAYLVQHTGRERQVYSAKSEGTLVSNPFEAAFSRAVRGLVARQCVTPLWLVPLDGWDRDYMRERDLEWLDDGVYFQWGSRQIRFVKR
jgi:hypothetical protein